MKTHIFNHVEDKLSLDQHGFVGGRSCTSNLLEAFDTILDMIDDGLPVDGGGPTPFLYMATRFLANVHVQNVQNVQKLFFPVWKFPGKIYLLWLIHNDRYITWECI